MDFKCGIEEFVSLFKLFGFLVPSSESSGSCSTSIAPISDLSGESRVEEIESSVPLSERPTLTLEVCKTELSARSISIVLIAVVDAGITFKGGYGHCPPPMSATADCTVE